MSFMCRSSARVNQLGSGFGFSEILFRFQCGLLVLGLAAAAAAATENPFETSDDAALSGRFTGPTIHLVARPAGEAWRGEIARKGTNHLFEARMKGSQLEGVERAEDRPRPFILARRSNGFYFSTGSFSEMLQKVAFPALSGLYTSKTLSVWFVPTGPELYEGSISFRGQYLPFTAHVDCGDLSGTFKTAAGLAPFTVANDPRGLIFRAGTLADIIIKAKEQPAAGRNGPTPQLNARWTNSLGMVFVPVAQAQVLFGQWETRVRDFTVYANEAPGVFGSWRNPSYKSVAVDNAPNCPVVNVNYPDALAFCEWLTVREQSLGLIAKTQGYRLPTDLEWSIAAEISELERPGSPKEKDGAVLNMYPWGPAWPPPPGTGNFADQSATKVLGAETIASYRDGFATTAPVGSFTPNKLGLFDLSGNVWEWCSDLYTPGREHRVLRGGAWSSKTQRSLLSTFRYDVVPTTRSTDVGFRCVLTGAPSQPSASSK